MYGVFGGVARGAKSKVGEHNRPLLPLGEGRVRGKHALACHFRQPWLQFPSPGRCAAALSRRETGTRLEPFLNTENFFPMTLLFKELAGSPVETFSPEGMKAQRRLLCAYEDRQEVVAALLGDGFEFSGQPRAAYPGRPGVLVAQVRVEPFEKRPDHRGPFTDPTADLNSYSGQFVEIVVEYEMLDTAGRDDLPEAPPGTLLTYRMSFGGEYLLVPGYGLQWQSATSVPVPPDAAPTLRVPVLEHHVTWHRVTSPPWDAIRQCAGAVNAAGFLGAEAETLLLDGAKVAPEFAGFDEAQSPRFAWRITYVFREKSIKLLSGEGEAVYGWNHAYRGLPPDSCWDRLVDDHGNSLYRLINFSSLFELAA
jgi:hypothetical protein